MRQEIMDSALDLFEDACISIGRRTGWKGQEFLRMLAWIRMLNRIQRQRRRTGV